MKYKNPKVREGVNYSNEHPLKGFLQLLFGVVAICVVAIVIMHFLSGYLVRYIPFEFEQKMVKHIEFLKPEPSPQQIYLQDLADKLFPHLDLPAGMKITLHYSDEDIVNAFATLGGHVFFYKGLLDKLDSEDALATVMGHEIAHVKHRHPMVALSKGLTLVALGSVITGSSGSQAGEFLINNSMNLGLMKFSRDQESESDQTSMNALYNIYHHIGGAYELFNLFSELDGAEQKSYGREMFRSHPYSSKRWETLRAMAIERNWPVKGKLTKLTFPKTKAKKEEGGQ